MRLYKCNIHKVRNGVYSQQMFYRRAKRCVRAAEINVCIMYVVYSS